jgi:hypothetical protein
MTTSAAWEDIGTRNTAIKGLLWLYFWLLLWEGVLRKWVFPNMSDVIFVIRDPVALLIYGLAFRAGVFPWRPAVVMVGAMAIFSLLFSLTVDTRLLVTLFGVRTDFLHLPLIFVMERVLTRRDVIRFGRWFLICSVPIVYLMYRQFNAPQDAAINMGAAGSVGTQLVAANDKIRPAGPFSFISGPILYFSLVASFVFYGWLQPGVYSRFLLIAATAATVISVPISISRSLLLGVLIVAAFGLAVTIKDPRRIPRFLGPVVAAAGFLAFAANTVYVQTFAMRWDDAMSQGAAGGIVPNTFGRYSAELLEPFGLAVHAPLLGYGIGLGTIGGARLSTGQYDFLLAESELSRCVLELGPILGFAFIAWRVWLTLKLVLGGWRGFLGEGDALSWLIAGSTFLNILIGQWGPSTQLGYSVFGAGLALAAAGEARKQEVFR